MSEREKQTRFLKELIRTEDREELQELQARITQAERDERCIRSAVWLMFVLVLISGAGLGYSAVFVREFFDNTTPLVVKVFTALVMASFMCLVGFLGFWFWTRAICNRLYDECRNLIISLHQPPPPPPSPFPAALIPDYGAQVYTIVTPETGHEAQIITLPQGTFASYPQAS